MTVLVLRCPLWARVHRTRKYGGSGKMAAVNLCHNWVIVTEPDPSAQSINKIQVCGFRTFDIQATRTTGLHWLH